MKKCPRCGADLSDGTTSFCPVCGKETENCEDCIKVSQSKKKEPKKKRNKSQRKQESKTEDIPEVMGEPVDDGYDGYYDDVLPPDQDRISEGLDKKGPSSAAPIPAEAPTPGPQPPPWFRWVPPAGWFPAEWFPAGPVPWLGR